MRLLVTGSRLLDPGAPPGADAVLLEGGRVVAVGSREELSSPEVERHQHPGPILPAMRDAHIHPLALAGSTSTVDLSGTSSFGDLLARIEAAAGALAPGTPLIASGMDDEQAGRLPTRGDLDPLLGDRPALLYRVCSHIASANTAALELAGIRPHHPDPDGGTFERDPTGVPTGVLRETAIAPVAAAVGARLPPPAPSAILRVLDELAGAGIGEIHAMVSTGSPTWCGPGNELEALLSIADRSPIEVAVFVITDDAKELEAAAERCTGRLRFGGWKGFADGSLGGHTAALRQGYADRPAEKGLLRLRPERDHELASAAISLGGAAAIHAIGDAAVEATLDLFASTRREHTDGELRIEHASVLSPELIERMADLGVIASIQPSFAVSDAPWLEKRLGEERREWAYPFRSLEEAGVRLLLGSDAPIEPADPWVTLSAAIEGAGPASLQPDTALAAAAASPLGPGAAGDLVVLAADHGPGLPPAAPVAAVYRAGRLVSARAGRSASSP